MDTFQVCRLCVSEIHNFIDIFGEIGQRMKIAKMLQELFGFEVSKNDPLSKTICTQCWSKTSEFHDFYKSVRVAQEQLIAMNATNGSNSSKQIDCDKVICNNETETNKDSKKIDESPIKTELSMISDESNPIEQHFQGEITDHFEFCSDLEGSENVDNVKSAEEDNSEEKGEIMDTNQIKIENDEMLLGRKKYTKSKDSRKGKSGRRKRGKIPRRIIVAEEDELIRKYVEMQCDLCTTNFVVFNEARQHYRDAHQISGYLSCCGRMYYRKNHLLRHMPLHTTPNSFQCELCEKIFPDKTMLKGHLENHQAKDVAPYICDICSDSFIQPSRLLQHMRRVHGNDETLKFGCLICDTKFDNQCSLTTHIRQVHEYANAHVCDICAKFFKTRHSFELHKQEHLNIERPRMRCNICGSQLKNERSLRRHLRRHTETSQTCKICNKTMANKHSLDTHIRSVHVEKSFQCSMCAKAFKNPVSLKEHIAGHTGETIYTCTYCPEAFKSSANRHKHRKKFHYEYWLRDRRLRLGGKK